MATYNFSILNDFPNGKVSIDRLTGELAASITGIVPALSHINTVNDVCSVFYMASLSESEESALNAVVASHSGVPLPQGSTDTDGNPVFAPTFMHATHRARAMGYRFSAPANQSTIHDVEVTTQILIQGGQFWAKGSDGYDYADFSVVDKNDTLGLHTLYSIPLGTPIELIKYVNAYQIPGGEIWHDSIQMPTVAPVRSGLFLRCTYHNVSNVNVEAGILYRWYVSP